MNSGRRYDGVDGPKVAIAHDYITQMGGAEKVVLSMSRAFPHAPIYTMLYEPSTSYPDFADRDVRTSGLNKLRLARKHFRAALPIFPLVAESMVIDADIVLTSSSGWAHGFRTRGRKLVCCHSPARWLYLPDQYLGDEPSVVSRLGLRLTSPYLKAWDRRKALECDRYLAVSTQIQGRIEESYGIDADILFPPVAMSQTQDVEPIPGLESPADDGYYLCVSRLLPYKNVDVVIRAFADTGRRLVVAGRGPEAARLRAMKTPNVTMVSDLTDGQMGQLYKNCRALLAASYEDYGLTPIEAGVWGRPTVALRFGGFLDTIDDGVTGLYFAKPEPADIAAALDRFETMTFDANRIRSHVEQFSEKVFARKLYAAVDELAKAVPSTNLAKRSLATPTRGRRPIDESP